MVALLGVHLPPRFSAEARRSQTNYGGKTPVENLKGAWLLAGGKLVIVQCAGKTEVPMKP